MVNRTVSAGLRTQLFAAARAVLVLGLLLAAAPGAVAAPAAQDAATGAVKQGASSHFVIENVGQFAGEARFFLKLGDRHVWMTGDALWLTAPDVLPEAERFGPASRRAGKVGREQDPAAVARPRTAIRFTFPGANPAATLEPFGRLATHVSYLMGSDPANWRVDVPAWSGVRYRDLYPGVDLVIGEGAGGTVPWRFEAQPGADTSAVSLLAEGAKSVAAEAGALRLEIKGQTLKVGLPGWSWSGQAPRVESSALQQDGGAFALAPAAQPAAVEAEVVAAGDLIYETPLAGSLYDVGYAIAADGPGNTYITGQTTSAKLPVTPGAYDPTNNGAIDPTEAFVAKFDPSGTATPLYLTYLGGSDFDIGWGIAVSSGVAFVAGETRSTDWPDRTLAVQDTDGFVAALNPDGKSLRYLHRMGGASYDAAYAIAVVGQEAYITGMTQSTSVCAGSSTADLVVRKLTETGGTVYTTCFVYGGTEAGYGIAVRNGEAYVAGETLTTSRNIIVTKFATGGALAGGIEFGGSDNDWGRGIAVDSAGLIYVAGTTMSSIDLLVTAGTAPWGGGATDAVVMKLASDFAVNFATYLGGDGDDSAVGIAVDTVGGLYVTGSTTSATFPMTTGAYSTSSFGGTDAFAVRMHPTGTTTSLDKVTYATYLGTAGEDFTYGVATDTGGHEYVVGAHATDGENPNTYDAFVAKVKVNSPLSAPAVTIARSGTNNVNVQLTWIAVAGRSKYQVFRSGEPYFLAGDWSSTRLAEPTAPSYTDGNVLTAVSTYFYLVKTVDASPAASGDSIRTGEFTYQLVKGTP